MNRHRIAIRVNEREGQSEGARRGSAQNLNSELARGAFVTRQTMNTLLRGLQDRGLVTRPTKASTGRALPTTLTPEGEDALDQAVSRVETISALMVSSLDETQKSHLGEALDLCIEALDPKAS